jgi:hypothetical protein
MPVGFALRMWARQFEEKLTTESEGREGPMRADKARSAGLISAICRSYFCKSL